MFADSVNNFNWERYHKVRKKFDRIFDLLEMLINDISN
jgi:hypothetical protein